jgi:hypothetical protein
MGTLFSKSKSNKISDTSNPDKGQYYETLSPTKCNCKHFPEYSIKDIVQHYEYIKHTKQIYDIDKALNIANNTNWDNIVDL